MGVCLGSPVAVILCKEILGSIEVEQRRSVLLEHDGRLLLVENLCPGAEYVFLRIGNEVQCHLVTVHRVGKIDNGLGTACARLCLVRLVFKYRRVVVISTVDVQCRLEIVLHAVRKISLLAQRQVGVIGGVGQFLAEIALIQAPVVAYGEHDARVVGRHNDLFVGKGCAPCKRNASRDEEFCQSFHVIVYYLMLSVVLVLRDNMARLIVCLSRIAALAGP